MYLLPVPAACVDAPASDGPFANDPALSGSSTYAVQSFIIVTYLLPVLIACVDAPASDGPFANDPALSGSPTYAVQSYIIVM